MCAQPCSLMPESGASVACFPLFKGFLAPMENTSRCGRAAFLDPPLAPLVVPSPRLSQWLSLSGASSAAGRPFSVGLACLVLGLGSSHFPGAHCPPGCWWATLQYLALFCQPRVPFSTVSVNAFVLTGFLVLPACLRVPSPPWLGEFAAPPSILRVLPQCFFLGASL